MIKTTPWFQRKFDLNFPADHFPNMVERLRGTPARLEDRLNPMKKEKLIQRVSDQWTIQEHAGHLLDLEPLWNNRLNDFMSGSKTLCPADLENKKTYAADHNVSPVADILDSFRNVRLDFVERLDSLDEKAVVISSLHPRLNKPMLIIDMVYFIAEHDDHHFRIITELIQSL